MASKKVLPIDAPKEYSSDENTSPPASRCGCSRRRLRTRSREIVIAPDGPAHGSEERSRSPTAQKWSRRPSVASRRPSVELSSRLRRSSAALRLPSLTLNALADLRNRRSSCCADDEAPRRASLSQLVGRAANEESSTTQHLSSIRSGREDAARKVLAAAMQGGDAGVGAGAAGAGGGKQKSGRRMSADTITSLTESTYISSGSRSSNLMQLLKRHGKNDKLRRDRLREADILGDEISSMLSKNLKWRCKLLPHSPIRAVWDVFALAGLLYLLYTVPLYIAFDEALRSEGMRVCDVLVDLLFGVDLALRLFVFIEVSASRLLLLSSTRIAHNYLTGWFWIDVFSVLPLDWITGDLLWRWVRLVRLLRVPSYGQSVTWLRLLNFCGGVGEALQQIKPQSWRIVAMMVSAVFLAYLFGCFGLFLARENEDASTPTWLEVDISAGRSPAGDSSAALWEHCLRAGYWALTTISTVGYGDIFPANRTETILSCLIAVVGTALFPAVIANMLCLSRERNARDTEHEELLSSLRYFMRHRHFPTDLQGRILGYHNYLHHKRQGVREVALLQELPAGIREEIIAILARDTVKRVRAFESLDDDALGALLTLLVPVLYGPRDLLFSQGDLALFVILIQKGHVQLVHRKTGDLVLAELSDGEVLGEAALFSTRRYETARSKGFSDCFELPVHEVNQVLERYHASLGENQGKESSKMAERRAARHLAVMRNLRSIKVRRVLVFNPILPDAIAAKPSACGRTLAALSRLLAPLSPQVGAKLAALAAPGQRTARRSFKTHLEPAKPLRRGWEGACALFMVLQAAVVPVAPAILAHNDGALGALLAIDCALTAFFVADWLLRAFALPILGDEGEVVTASPQVFRHFVHSSRGCLSALALPPLSLVALAFEMPAFEVALFGFVRLVRLPLLRAYVSAAWRPTALASSSAAYSGLLRLCHLFALVSFTGHLVGSLWLLLLDVQPEGTQTWADQMSFPVGDASVASRYLRAVYWAHSTMLTVAYGDIIPVNREETMLACATMLFGVFMYAEVIGSLASLMESLDQQRVLYEQRHESITVAARGNAAPTPLANRISDFYERFWRSAKGTSAEVLLKSLPRALQTDVCSFLYLRTLSQLEVFASCKEPFLLELTRRGTEMLCMPGDYVVRQGEHGQEIFVVIQGQVDVIQGSSSNVRGSSIYDMGSISLLRGVGAGGVDEEVGAELGTEVARLGAGQAFGEHQALLEQEYGASYCCKTFSVLLSISRATLDSVFHLHPHMFTVVMANAEALPDVAQSAPPTPHSSEFRLEGPPAVAVQADSGIERSPSGLFERSFARREELSESTPPTGRRSSRDAPSDGRETETELDSLRGLENPSYEGHLVVLPKSRIRHLLSLTSFVFFLYDALTVPYVAAFSTAADPFLVAFNVVADTFYLSCTVLHMRYIAQVDGEGRLLKAPPAIRRQYARGFLVPDVIASLPLDLLASASGNFEVSAVLRLLHLVRIVHLAEFVGSLESTTGGLLSRSYSPLTVNAIFKILGVALLIAIVAHWAACSFAAIGQAHLNDASSTSWLVPEAEMLDSAGDANRNRARYVRALYWASFTLSTVCYGDIVPTNENETLAALLLIFIAALLLSALIGSVTTLLRVGTEKAAAELERRMGCLTAFLRTHPVPAELQQRTLRYYRYRWDRMAGVDQRQALETSELPLTLQREVALHINWPILHKVPFFKRAPPGFLGRVALVLTPQIFQEGESVIWEGETGSQMYFVNAGRVHVVGPDGKSVVAELREGSFFGEIALVYSIKRTATVRASTMCELFELTKAGIDECLKYYPNMRRALDAAAAKTSVKATAVRQSEARASAAIKGDASAPADAPAAAPASTPAAAPAE